MPRTDNIKPNSIWSLNKQIWVAISICFSSVWAHLCCAEIWNPNFQRRTFHWVNCKKTSAEQIQNLVIRCQCFVSVTVAYFEQHGKALRKHCPFPEVYTGGSGGVQCVWSSTDPVLQMGYHLCAFSTIALLHHLSKDLLSRWMQLKGFCLSYRPRKWRNSILRSLAAYLQKLRPWKTKSR